MKFVRLSIVWSLFSLVSLCPLLGKGRSTFEVLPDGTVIADGLTFSSMSEYTRSDYFKVAGKRCGTSRRIPSSARTLGDASDCSTLQTVIKDEYQRTQNLTIPVVVHVIHMVDGTGNVTDDTILDQIRVLNEDYGAIAGSLGEKGFNTRVQFALAGVTRTANDTWHEDIDELEYKTKLGWDQKRYLNIYLNTAGGYLGYSYFPQDDAGDAYDGVVINYGYFGGRDYGEDPAYNQGRTTVHEVGHYLGLYHTFEGYECLEGYQAGDLIADTNPESDEHYGCDQTYSCTLPDNIHNYLNYTDDSCMEEFTREQSNRMICSIVNYRPLLGIASPLDLNLDGAVNGLDAAALSDLLCSSTLSLPCGIFCGDVNGDRKTDVLDLMFLRKAMQ